jgi:ABC-type amino acid transport system permease subunit
VISLQELLTSSENLAAVKFQYIEAYAAALVYYLVIVSILMLVQSRLERRFTWTSRKRGRVSAPAVPAIPHDAR